MGLGNSRLYIKINDNINNNSFLHLIHLSFASNDLSAMCLYYTYQDSYVMRCAIWYHLYNLKNVKNTHGGVLILVKPFK